MRPRKPGHVDGGPGQHPGDDGAYEEHGQEVGQDVDGLVVPVGQAVDAPEHIQGRTVVVVDIPKYFSCSQIFSQHNRRHTC